MSAYFYNKWKDEPYLPIECLINMVLLYKKKRTIIQFDISYYDNPKVKSRIKHFTASCRGIVKRRDASNNIVVYLKEKQESIERKLFEIGKGVIEDAFRTAAFADMLDPIFYECKGPFPAVLNKPRAVQVLINVIKDEREVGAVLIVMCDLNVRSYTERLFAHFLKLSKEIEKIDSTLQTSLMYYTKPGPWKESPEYVASRMRLLP